MPLAKLESEWKSEENRNAQADTETVQTSFATYYYHCDQIGAPPRNSPTKPAASSGPPATTRSGARPSSCSICAPAKAKNWEISKTRSLWSNGTTDRRCTRKILCSFGGIEAKMVADHIDPLVVEHYRTGNNDVVKQTQVSSVQSHGPTCSRIQGGQAFVFSKCMAWKI